MQFLRERNNTLAGRKVELFVADSGGVPAQARTKIQELVERDNIHVMIGPLAAASALAADDYIRPGEAAHALRRRGRGPDAAQAQSVVHARHLDLVAVRASARRLLLQDAQVPPHGDDRGRHRLRPRDVRRLPARVRGPGRQDRAENVSAAHRARLRDLPRAAQDQYRRHLPRLRRLERLSLPAPVQRVRPARQGRAGGRHDRARRGGAAQHGRRGARHRHRLLVFGRARQSDQQEIRGRLPRRMEVRPRLLRRGDLRRGRGARGDAERDQGQDRGQGGVHEGGAQHQGRHLPRPGIVRRVRQRGRQRLYPQGRAQGRPAGESRDPHLPQREPVLDLQARRSS